MNKDLKKEHKKELTKENTQKTEKIQKVNLYLKEYRRVMQIILTGV